jgi:ATP-binding cassette, subfamily B, bacterial MsbA
MTEKSTSSASDIKSGFIDSINSFVRFLIRTETFRKNDIWKLALFVVLSVFLAITEGVSMTLIIPILNVQSQAGSLAEVPILGKFLQPLDHLQSQELLMALALILAGVIITRGLLQYICSRLSLLIPITLQHRLTRIGYERIINARVGYVEKKEIGEINNCIQNHSRRFAVAIKAFIDIFSTGLLIIAYSFVMVAISWKMTLLSLVFVFCFGAVISFALIKPLRALGAGFTAANTLLLRLIYEAVHGHRLVHISSSQEWMINKFEKATSDYFAFDKKRRIVAVTQSPLVMTGAGLFICGIIYVSALTTTGNDTSWIGPVLIFVLCLYRMLTPVIAINTSRTAIAANHHSMDVLWEFFDSAEAAFQPTGDMQCDGLHGDIMFENVSFSYGEDTNATLKNISLIIPHKKMTAIVGPSGAGKTSLIGLLARFFDPQDGRLLVNGLDLNDLDVSSWRQQISLVSQHSILFNDTVLNNLCFGGNTTSIDLVHQALEQAAASNFIQQLPDGLQTIIGDKGVRLSGGEQQRLGIARSILSDPDLLLLDEATSHLDSLTEKAVQGTLSKFHGQKTTVVIAHRLSTIMQADKIYVMDQGRIVEEGTHAEMMKNKGLYSEMVEHQEFSTDLE